MKKVALVVIAALVFTIYIPRAQAQPFADVPTDIFAFDAVAELAAKGIIEGYPDGTFKGDRAMTRYEMAMVVARILARIEAIKIPAAAPAPPPGVSAADLAAVQRLVNEFRAELAAQGVRVTAVEEELAAIRARLSNVRITGDLRFRYSFGTVLSTATSGGRVQDAAAQAVYRARLTFTGQVAPNVRATTRLITTNVHNPAGSGSAFATGSNIGGGSSQFVFGTSNSGYTLVGFDNAYVDLDPLYGVGWRLGRQLYTLAPVGLSDYGLLFDPADVGNTGMIDGLRVKGSFGGMNWEVGGWAGTPSKGVSPVGEPEAGANTFYTGSVSTNLIPGWTLRLSAVSQQRNGSAVAPNQNTSDTGWSVDANGTIIPGVGIGAAYASFTGNLATGVSASSQAYTAWLNFDLGSLTGMTTFSPKLGVQYKNYGADLPTVAPAPIYTGATTEVFQQLGWSFNGFAVLLNLKFTPDLSGTFSYESGNSKALGTPALIEYYVALDYNLATRTSIGARWFRSNVGAATDNFNFYRIQLTYSY